jgi:hypothetical protein
MIDRVRSLERARVDRAELARTEVVDLARGGAAAQRATIYAIRAMLQVLAHVYSKTAPGQFDCNQMLFDLTGNAPWIYGTGVVGRDGRVVCATEPRAIGLNLGDRPYFQQMLRTRDFVLSDYLITRGTGVPGVTATYPIIRGDGTFAGAVMASINLQWMADLAETAARRAGTSVALGRWQRHAHRRIGGSGGFRRQNLRGARADASNIGRGRGHGNDGRLRRRPAHLCVRPHALDAGAAGCRPR